MSKRMIFIIFSIITKMSTTTPKHVMFTMEVGETPNPDEHIDHNKLEEMVKELSQSLTGVKQICFVDFT